MVYLLSKMLLCLLLAALLGFLIGWFLRAFLCRREQEEQEVAWKVRLEDCHRQLEVVGVEKDKWRRKYDAAVADAASAKVAADEARATAAAAANTAAANTAAANTAAQATIIPLMGSGAEDRKDDLKKVEGIGPKIEGLLNAGGIWTWAQLAVSPVPTLQGVLKAAGERYRIHDPTTWPDQSRLASEGRWEELAKLQDLLKGGRLS